MAFMFVYTGSGFDLWLFFRQRKKLAEALRQQELKRAQEARREAELRLSVLVAQIEPHFLFNTLAGVRSAILTEPARATAIVDHLVDYLRATIPQMRDDGASVQGRLAQQLEAAKAYLALMQARIPRLSFTVETEVVDAALPPLMLISLVENAIKHGVEPKIGPVHISVKARKLQRDGAELLELTVFDNGVGFGGTTSGSGIGLANIRERLDAIFGQRASLQLKARAEGGVAAIIVLPLLS
jgi:LytS/YehU family sensor histidine kinase